MGNILALLLVALSLLGGGSTGGISGLIQTLLNLFKPATGA
jgi:hypothetical protein